jgi:hypothetical protein
MDKLALSNDLAVWLFAALLLVLLHFKAHSSLFTVCRKMFIVQ